MNWREKPIKVLAVALILWCAGAGCMMVSYARAEDPEAAPACHAHRQKNRKAASSRATADRVGQVNLPAPTRSGALSCCPLVSGSIATASRVQVNDAHESAPAADPANNLDDFSYPSAPLAVPLRLPNQHHLYLRGCVFLI